MNDSDNKLRILIVSESASVRFGGEAILPFHYFRILRQRGYPVWLLVHARTRDELAAIFPNDQNIHYVEDKPIHRLLYRIGTWMPARVALFTAGFALRVSSQRAQRRLARKLVADERINVVHQPMPVSPKEPSMMYALGAPVVIGPMNGGMDYPPAFRGFESAFVRAAIGVGRSLSDILNRLIPGKLQSPLLLVANERTRKALPAGISGKVVELVENAVDMAVWKSEGDTDSRIEGKTLRLVFIGRLVDFKAADLLIEAFRQASVVSSTTLTIVGDGPLREALETMARAWGILGTTEGEAGKVFFAGWRTQRDCAAALRSSDALVLPSLMDCGGAVVLEAMAAGRAVIASDWGGPADYLDPSCGILVKPDSRAGFIDGLSSAMLRLANDPALARAMGDAGRQKVIEQFSWEVKVDRVLELYAGLLSTGAGVALQGANSGSWRP